MDLIRLIALCKCGFLQILIGLIFIGSLLPQDTIISAIYGQLVAIFIVVGLVVMFVDLLI